MNGRTLAYRRRHAGFYGVRMVRRGIAQTYHDLRIHVLRAEWPGIYIPGLTLFMQAALRYGRSIADFLDKQFKRSVAVILQLENFVPFVLDASWNVLRGFSSV